MKDTRNVCRNLSPLSLLIVSEYIKDMISDILAWIQLNLWLWKCFCSVRKMRWIQELKLVLYLYFPNSHSDRSSDFFPPTSNSCPCTFSTHSSHLLIYTHICMVPLICCCCSLHCVETLNDARVDGLWCRWYLFILNRRHFRTHSVCLRQERLLFVHTQIQILIAIGLEVNGLEPLHYFEHSMQHITAIYFSPVRKSNMHSTLQLSPIHW